ncbi:RABC2A, partial [Symbiodinium sp. CCMP2456]
MADFDPIQRRKVQPRPKDVINLKLMTLGDVGVGKSTLVHSFCADGDVVLEAGEPTVGADFKVKMLKHAGKDFRVNIWDASGDLKFIDVRNEFYKEAQGVVLVFDVTSKRSFQNLEKWTDEVTRYAQGSEPIYAVVGTKTDLHPRLVQEQAVARYTLLLDATHRDHLSVAECMRATAAKVILAPYTAGGTGLGEKQRDAVLRSLRVWGGSLPERLLPVCLGIVWVLVDLWFDNVHVTCCENVRTRLAMAKPPQAPWPNDVEVPSTSFDEIIVCASSVVRNLVSRIGLELVKDQVGTQWATAVFRNHPRNIEELEREVIRSKCMLMANTHGDVERLAAVSTINISRRDGTSLMQLGTWDPEVGLRVSCKLPGTKQELGETAQEAMSRVLETDLLPFKGLV